MADGTRPLMSSDLFTAETVLCPATGLGAWLVWRRIDIGLARKRAALRCWGWLLMLSALWTAALQNGGNPAVGLGALLVCLAVAIRTTLVFRPIRPAAAVLLIPYATWLCIMAAVIVRF